MMPCRYSYATFLPPVFISMPCLHFVYSLPYAIYHSHTSLMTAVYCLLHAITFNAITTYATLLCLPTIPLVCHRTFSSVSNNNRHGVPSNFHSLVPAIIPYYMRTCTMYCRIAGVPYCRTCYTVPVPSYFLLFLLHIFYFIRIYTRLPWRMPFHTWRAIRDILTYS